MIEFISSEVACLVLGYLEEKECHNSYSTFLFECGDLAECRKLLKEGKEYSVTVGLEGQNTLLTILQEYCRLKSHVRHSAIVPNSHQTVPERANESPQELVLKTNDETNCNSMSDCAMGQRMQSKSYAASVKPESSQQRRTPSPKIISTLKNRMSIQIAARRRNALKSRNVMMNCQIGRQNTSLSPVMQRVVKLPSLQVSPARQIFVHNVPANCSAATARESNSCQNTPTRANRLKSKTGRLMECSAENGTQTEKLNCSRRNIDNGKVCTDAENSQSLPTEDVHSSEDNSVSETVIAASILTEESNLTCGRTNSAVSVQEKVNSICGPTITSSSVCINSSPSVSAKVDEVLVRKVTEVQVAATCTTVTDNIPSSPMDTEASVGSRHDLVSATSEYCGEPPSYNRAPAMNSPRIILSHEHSMVASLTTPVKDWQHLKEEEWHSPKRKSLIPRRRMLSEMSLTSKQNVYTDNSADQWTTLDDIFNFPALAEKIAENINLVKNAKCTEEKTKAVSDQVKESPASLDVCVPDEIIKEILFRIESDPVFEEYVNYMTGRWDSSRDGSEMIASASCSCDSAEEIRNDIDVKPVFHGINGGQPEDCNRHAVFELPEGSSETGTTRMKTSPKAESVYSEVKEQKNKDKLHSAEQNSVPDIKKVKIEITEIFSLNPLSAVSQAQTKTAFGDAEVDEANSLDNLTDNSRFGGLRENVDVATQSKNGSVHEEIAAGTTSLSAKDSSADNTTDPIPSAAVESEAERKAEGSEPRNNSVQETEMMVPASGAGDGAPFMYFFPSSSANVPPHFIILPSNQNSVNATQLRYASGQSAAISENRTLSKSPLRSLVENQSLPTDPPNWGAMQTSSMETASEQDSTTSGMTTPSLPKPGPQGVQFIALSPSQLQGVKTGAVSNRSRLPMILPKVPGLERKRVRQNPPKKRKRKNPTKFKPKRPRVRKPQKEKNIFVISQAASEQKPKQAAPRAAMKYKKKPQRTFTTLDQDVDDPPTVEETAKTLLESSKVQLICVRQEEWKQQEKTGQRKKNPEHFSEYKRGGKRNRREENVTILPLLAPKSIQAADSVLSPYSERSVNSLAVETDDNSSDGPLVVDEDCPSPTPLPMSSSSFGKADGDGSKLLSSAGSQVKKRGTGRTRGRPRGSRGPRGNGRGRGNLLSTAAAELAGAQTGKSAAFAAHGYSLSGVKRAVGSTSPSGNAPGGVREGPDNSESSSHRTISRQTVVARSLLFSRSKGDKFLMKQIPFR